jgi:hypothetical protein
MRMPVSFGQLCRRLFGAVLAFCASAAVAPAYAQLVQQYFPADIPGYAGNFGASVVNRMMMLNQTNGINVGDFTVRPVASENTGYNSNVLGVSGSGSAEADTSASVRVNSNWARDAIGASLSVDNHRYFDLPEASFTNWTAGVGGSVNLGNDVATIAYSHLNLNLSATDLGVFGVITPAPYSVDDVRLSYEKLFSRFSITPLLEYENFDFGQSSGANPVNFDSLSHQTVIGGVTGRYNVSPGNAAVVILRTSDAQFSSQSTGSNNSYLDYAGFLGVDFRSDAVLQYRALFGAESRNFTQSNAATITAPVFELDAIWLPSDLDTITATIARRLDDPASPFARNQTIFDGRLELDHELRQNVFLTAYAEIGKSDSQSNVAGLESENETQEHFGARARWYLTQHVSASLSYGFSHSSANGNSTVTTTPTTTDTSSGSFTSNVIMVGFSVFE